MSKINPPFRADHVCSLLRPEALLKARQRYHNKEISKEALREVEDQHIAEVLFNELNVDAYFLEYDDERSGDFVPLCFVLDGKTVVLGLVTTKLPDLEFSRDLIQPIKKPGSTCPWKTCALAPNVAFPAPFTATKSTRMTNGPSWSWLSIPPVKFGEIIKRLGISLIY